MTSPLEIKLVAFGKLAFIQPIKGNSHPCVNEGSSRLDDDGDLIVVAVNEPVEWQSPSL